MAVGTKKSRGYRVNNRDRAESINYNTMINTVQIMLSIISTVSLYIYICIVLDIFLLSESFLSFSFYIYARKPVIIA